jgi:hypothetical protein
VTVTKAEAEKTISLIKVRLRRDQVGDAAFGLIRLERRLGRDKDTADVDRKHPGRSRLLTARSISSSPRPLSTALSTQRLNPTA